MVSVLGKRARAPNSSNDSPSISSRVKRRTRISFASDENVDLVNCHNDNQDVRCNVDCMEADTEDHVPPSPSDSPTRRLLYAKRNRNEARIGFSARESNNEPTHGVPVKDKENIVQLPTPKTPRHKDVLSKRIPITPRHRIGLASKTQTPRTLRTPLTPRNAPTVYNPARHLFSKNAYPGRLIGRNEERKGLKSFLEEGHASRSGRCLYVSGPPGTGKSALVREVCNEVKGTDGVKAAYINCMSIKTSEQMYMTLTSELLGDELFPERDPSAQLRSIFVPRKKSEGFTYVVTLDEIDHLVTLDTDILYTLFEWSHRRYSRLIVIGIANALDLTERFLPQLKARNLKPQLLPFLPYTASQIASIITTKLQSLLSDGATDQPDFVPFIHPTAIQLCAKKVASQTGDIRKAFEIIRRTIDVVETEAKAKHEAEVASRSLWHSPTRSPLVENPNLASLSPYPAPTVAASLADLTPLTAPRATIAHVSRVSAAAFSNGTYQRLQTLNLHQKAALCAFLSHQKTSRNAMTSVLSTPTKALGVAPTVKRLYEIYCCLSRRENALHPLTATEFADVISGLETLGLVGEENGRRGRTRMVASCTEEREGGRRIVSFVDEKEIQACLGSIGGGILRSLLLGGDDR
ncbi:MAG: hypothetical protein Q9217_000309 [Psora testacea]